MGKKPVPSRYDRRLLVAVLTLAIILFSSLGQMFSMEPANSSEIDQAIESDGPVTRFLTPQNREMKSADGMLTFRFTEATINELGGEIRVSYEPITTDIQGSDPTSDSPYLRQMRKFRLTVRDSNDGLVANLLEPMEIDYGFLEVPFEIRGAHVPYEVRLARWQYADVDIAGGGWLRDDLYQQSLEEGTCAEGGGEVEGDENECSSAEQYADITGGVWFWNYLPQQSLEEGTCVEGGGKLEGDEIECTPVKWIRGKVTEVAVKNGSGVYQPAIFIEGGLQIPSDDYLPKVQPFQQIDLFTGSASFSMELEIPDGRGGLQPTLNLSYSSTSVDSGSPASPDMQGFSWVGYGFNLQPEGYIARQDINSWGYNNNCETVPPATRGREFSLVHNGASYDLLKSTDNAPPGNNVKYYRTKGETFWKIWPNNTAEGPDEWYAITKDGTKYSFTYVSKQGWRNNSGHCDNLQNYRWNLTRVEDRNGNVITYSYDRVLGERCLGKDTVQQVWLKEIRYNYSGTNGTGVARTRIEFNVDNFSVTAPEYIYSRNIVSRVPAHIHLSRYLDNIKVYVDTGSGERKRFEYDFIYNDIDQAQGAPATPVSDDGGFGKKKLTLYSVKKIGYDPDGTYDDSLPAPTFLYYIGDCGQAQQDPYDPTIWSKGCNRLMEVYNGWGGFERYSYEDVFAGHVDFPHKYRVKFRRVFDPTVSENATIQNVESRWEIWYLDWGLPNHPNTARVNDAICVGGVSADAGTVHPRSSAKSQFRGHYFVTILDPEGNYQTRTFFQDDILKGKEDTTIFFQGTDWGHAIKSTRNTYEYLEWTHTTHGYTPTDDKSRFIYLAKEIETPHEGSADDPAHWLITVYKYDEALQKDYNTGATGQFGNLTHVVECGHTQPDTNYNCSPYLRKTIRRYNVNTDQAVWIVDKVASEEVIDENGTRVSWRFFAYDNNCTFAQAPTIGNLQRQKQALSWSGDTASTLETAYLFDSFGNIIRKTLYNSEGTEINQGSCSPATVNAQTTQTTYDPTFNMYPVRVDFPNSTSIEAEYDLFKGKPARNIDENDAETEYKYDKLGRLVKKILPYDSANSPTVEIQYLDFGNPPSDAGNHQRTVIRRKKSETGVEKLIEKHFFDGLGQEIQVHNEWEDGYQIQTKQYNKLGKVERQFVPYIAYGAGSSQYISTIDLNTTINQFDGIGRVYRTIYPDGASRRVYFHPELKTASIDEQNHMTIISKDELSRIIKSVRFNVDRPNGPYSSDWNNNGYSRVHYYYNARDQITAIWQEDDPSLGTTIEYNQAGRKISMHDADMGDWYYLYDTIGNLIEQNANGNVVRMEYDNMNRMRFKDLPDGVTGGEYDVHLVYDDPECNNGLGRLCKSWVGILFYNNGKINHYDARGRVESSSYWLDLREYPFQSRYDPMDRVVSTIYPDHEIVRYTYGSHGKLTGITAQPNGQPEETIVDYISYDQFGTRQILLGDGLLQIAVDYSYYPWNGAYGEGRGRIETIAAAHNIQHGEIFQNITYNYDLKGNILQMTDSVTPSTSNFVYDKLDRLTWANYGGTQERFLYNNIGNLMQKGGVNFTYGQNAGPHALTSVAGQLNYTYDASGNQVTRRINGRNYSMDYNADGKIISVLQGTWFFNSYNAFGELIRKSDGASAHLFMGDYEAEGSIGIPESRTKYYQVNGKHIAMRRSDYFYNNGLFWLLQDHLGSTSHVVEASTLDVKEGQRYKAFGETLVDTTPDLTKYKFTGQREESDLPTQGRADLYFYKARWYDPFLGRFIQPDTVLPDAGDPQSLNPYSYVLNNPLRFTDPSGHSIFEEEPGCPHVTKPPETPDTPSYDNPSGNPMYTHEGRALVYSEGVWERVIHNRLYNTEHEDYDAYLAKKITENDYLMSLIEQGNVMAFDPYYFDQMSPQEMLGSVVWVSDQNGDLIPMVVLDYIHPTDSEKRREQGLSYGGEYNISWLEQNYGITYKNGYYNVKTGQSVSAPKVTIEYYDGTYPPTKPKQYVPVPNYGME